MHIELSAEALLDLLTRVTGVIPVKPRPYPILENVVFSRKDGVLEVLGTNLEQWIQFQMILDTGGFDERAALLPAHRLKDIVRLLPKEAIVSITCGQDGKEGHKVVCERRRYKLPFADPKDFPLLQEPVVPQSEFVVRASDLATLLKSVTHAIAGPLEARYYLRGCALDLAANGPGPGPGPEAYRPEAQGVVLQTTDPVGLSVTAVATDGHRLALCSTHAYGALGPAKQVILPTDAAKDLARLLDNEAKDKDSEVVVAMGEHRAAFYLKSCRFTTLLIDAKYPTYQRLIPDPDRATHVVVANRKELIGLTQAALTVPNIRHGVSLVCSPGKLGIQSMAGEIGFADVDMPVEYRGDGIEIGVNGDYLVEALSALSTERVAVRTTDPASVIRVDPVIDLEVGVGSEGVENSAVPVAVQSVQSVQVVMPMRL